MAPYKSDYYYYYYIIIVVRLSRFTNSKWNKFLPCHVCDFCCAGCYILMSTNLQARMDFRAGCYEIWLLTCLLISSSNFTVFCKQLLCNWLTWGKNGARIGPAISSSRSRVTFTTTVWPLQTHTHPFNGPLSRTTWVEQETVSGSGISWAICKSAPCFRQTTTPALKTRPLSFFTDRMSFMPPNQQRQSTEGNKHCKQHITYQTTTTVPQSFSSYIY